MMFFRLLLFISLLFISGGFVKISAQNIVTRTAEYAPELKDKLSVTYQGIKQDKDKNLEILLKIKSKNVDFNILSAQIIVCDSTISPIVPFCIDKTDNELSDSLVSWNCIIQFPRVNGFCPDDTWKIITSEGEYYGLLHYIPNQSFKKYPFFFKYSRYIVFGSISLAVLLCLVLCGYYLRRKNKFLKEKFLIRQQTESSNKINCELHKNVEKLFSERWSTFNQLCNDYLTKKEANSESIRTSVYKDLEKQIDNIKSPKTLAELERLINTYNDNLMHKIKIQIPSLTHNETTFLTYLYSGFSPRTICVLTGIDIKYFYNKRGRLRERILASDAPDRELFSSFM